MSIPQAQFADRTKTYEGNIAWMYRDNTPAGNITVGVGHKVSGENDAVTLPFIDKITGDAATDAAKKLEWDTISLATIGHPASFYADLAALRLQQTDIDALLLADLKQAEGDLKNAFANYDSFPGPAQEGLLDMMFNMGATKFTQANWPNFFAALNSNPPDWTTAANQCHRVGVPNDRNDAIKALFQQAAAG